MNTLYKPTSAFLHCNLRRIIFIIDRDKAVYFWAAESYIAVWNRDSALHTFEKQKD